MNSELAQQFLATLYPATSAGHLVLWESREKGSARFACTDFRSAAQLAATWATTRDVYFGLGLQRDAAARGRGTEETVVTIPGLWMDIDVRGTHNRNEHVPPTEAAALALLEAVSRPPSILVRSGGGVHAYWLFRAPWVLTTQDQRQHAKDLSSRFQRTIIAAGTWHAWRFDNTSDLARVLRVPGTNNHKSDPPRPVEIIGWAPGRRYEPDDFGHLPPAGNARHPYTPPPAEMPKDGDLDHRIMAYIDQMPRGMVEGDGRDNSAFRLAAWLRHDMARDEATTLGYLKVWNARQAEPLSDSILAEKVRSGERYGSRPSGCGIDRQAMAGRRQVLAAAACTSARIWLPRGQVLHAARRSER